MLQAIWIEIPVKNLERAMKFYQTVFGLDATDITVDGPRRTTTIGAMTQEGHPGISLNENADFHPSDKGTYVYYNAGDDLTVYLKRVEPAGGKILTEKLDIGGGAGFYASVQDTEGNVIGLYSPK